MRGSTKIRLAKIEAGRRIGAPTAVLSHRPIEDVAGDLAAADVCANWQRWVAQRKATVANGVLCLPGPELIDDEWMARFVTEH